MASEVEICNRALQRLGAKTIVSLTEASKNARQCNLAYNPVRLKMLADHNWAFATQRAQLAADATAPEFGRANAFELPADYVRIADDYPEDNFNSIDYVVEGRKILTDFDAPLEIRYIADITDPNLMDPIFREALSMNLANELVEVITQSNTKKLGIERDLKKVIAQARRRNAIQTVSAEPPIDTWETAREAEGIRRFTITGV